MITVFLGGTCDNTYWRDKLIELLDNNRVSAFNPVVKIWNKEAQEKELWHRVNDDLCLYTIIPDMTSYYTIAEVVDDSNKRPDKTIFCILEGLNGKTITEAHMKDYIMIKNMVEKNGSKVFLNLDDTANYINNYKK